jgi:DNA-binding transcriptional ArsR family regulator
MLAQLTLDLPWVQSADEQVVDGLVIRRGRGAVLTYDDGIALDVRVLDPARYRSPEALVEASRKEAGPGRVVLAAGVVPVTWRSQLRAAGLSFIDVAGIVEINWPRLRVSAKRFGQPIKRRRSPMPFQKGHALVVQQLLIAAGGGVRPTISDLAEGANVSLSTASRAVSELAQHGLVAKERRDKHVVVVLTDRVEVAERLAAQSAWPGDELLSGYLWGRTVFDVAAHISKNAVQGDLDLAVTGRVGAAFHGVLGTSSPIEVRCWVDLDGRDLPSVAGELGLEPAPEGATNITLSADPWRVGIQHRGDATFDEWTASIAHPVRVWCDLHSEQRGTEFAAQLWGAVVHAG